MSYLDRRGFLKLAGAAFLIAAGELARRKLPAIKDFWLEDGPLIMGEVLSIDNIASDVPPQLTEKDIPTNNEMYRPMEEIFGDGMRQYLSWMKENPNLDKLHYDKPSNYLDVPSLVEKVAPKLGEIPDRMGEDYWAFSWALDSLGEIDQPYAMISTGSMDSIRSLDNMITNDPGSGFVNNLRDSMKTQFGADFDVWLACRSLSLDSEQRAFAKQKFQDWYGGALSYIQGEVKKDGKPISTSALFAYFLFSNNGDILRSVWDTSSWLKITARNDIEDLKHNPNNEKAKLTTSLFKDEFSKKVSANWVADNVDANDRVLNNTNAYDSYQYKDYMPPNRAGFYHPWNIFGLGLHMSPFLLKRVVASHLSNTLEGYDDLGRKITEYGRERTVADWDAATSTGKISEMIEALSN